MTYPIFRRVFSAGNESSLTGSALFSQKLKANIDSGRVFPSIRNNKMHFYYRGGRLFEFNGGKFGTHIKYGFVPEVSREGYISEGDLAGIQPNKDFVSGYEKIMDRCAAYASVEALGVSALYQHSAWKQSAGNSDVVLLDIEAMFSNAKAAADDAMEDKLAAGYSHDRFDIVLYNGASRELRVFEAKHFSNLELWSSAHNPRVNEQIKRYMEVIAGRKKEIIDAYARQIDIMNRLFKKNFLQPQTISEKVGLLLFGFDINQQSKITDSDYINKPYKIGNVARISAATLFDSIG